MINYKELFLERMFAELSDKERDKNYKVICSHKQFANEEAEMQWFKEQYCHYYNFPTSDILNYKEKLFNLFDSLVDIKLTKQQALDLKALCQEEEDNFILRGDFIINKHYYSRVDLFIKVNYDYNNFKLNVGVYSAKSLDKDIDHDKLKNQAIGYNELWSRIPDELERLFEATMNDTLQKELSKQAKEIIKRDQKLLISTITSRTTEFQLRFNKYKIIDDSNYNRERTPKLLSSEIKTSKAAKLIKEVTSDQIKVKSINIQTCEGDINASSDLEAIITKKELSNLIIRKCYNSIEIAEDADASEAIVLFDNNKEAYLFRAIAKVFLDYGLLSYRDNKELIFSPKHPNRNKLNAKMNGAISVLIYDIATIIVGPLPKLKGESKDKNEKMTIDDCDTKIKKGYTRSRLDTFLIPFKFKV